jgi:hypothetical protein
MSALVFIHPNYVGKIWIFIFLLLFKVNTSPNRLAQVPPWQPGHTPSEATNGRFQLGDFSQDYDLHWPPLRPSPPNFQQVLKCLFPAAPIRPFMYVFCIRK